MSTTADIEHVLAANRALYEAFEARDMDAMSDVWEHSDRVRCTHPGWPTLKGWGAVASSWFGLLSGPQRLQFIITDEEAEIVGDVAWVNCVENLLGDSVGSTVTSINLFVRSSDGVWKMIAHHGGGVSI
ncbi:MAG: nuclear transport factor 2 family protein [Acidimicrobiia bacterium]